MKKSNFSWQRGMTCHEDGVAAADMAVVEGVKIRVRYSTIIVMILGIMLGIVRRRKKTTRRRHCSASWKSRVFSKVR